MREFFNLAFQFFILLTPFAVLSAFLSMTQDYSRQERFRVAIKTGIATVISCVALFYFGNFIFMLFGIGIDAFRIGGGTILFLNAIGLVRGNGNGNGSARAAEGKENPDDYDDIAVVPLAIPITVGPGTTAALIVMGADLTEWLPMIRSEKLRDESHGAFSIRIRRADDFPGNQKSPVCRLISLQMPETFPEDRKSTGG